MPITISMISVVLRPDAPLDPGLLLLVFVTALNGAVTVE